MSGQVTPNTAEGGTQPLQKLDSLRSGIGWVLFVSFPVLLVCVIGALVFLFFVIAGRITSGPQQKLLDVTEKMALAASVQVAIGMVMGFISVFIGLMMTWFGLSATFTFTGKSGDRGELSLQSSSPGLLFFLGGIILIGVSLYKPITYEDRANFRERIRQDIKPNPPPIEKAGDAK